MSGTQYTGQRFQFLTQEIAFLKLSESEETIKFKRGGSYEGQQDSRALPLLNRLGLSGRLDHKPSELSGGQQQRVALARMIANYSPVVLADELTGSLDSNAAGAVLDFLEEINREGRTTV